MAEKSMAQIVAELNIEHFRRKLAAETDRTKRENLLELLAKDEAKLREELDRTREVMDEVEGSVAPGRSPKTLEQFATRPWLSASGPPIDAGGGDSGLAL